MESSAREHDRRYSPTKDLFSKGYAPVPAMSTNSTMMNPAPPTFSNPKSHPPHGPPPPYRASASQPLPHHSGLVSPPDSHPTDSRRTSDDVKEQTRLPSILEAIGQQPSEARPTTTYSTYSTYTSAQPQTQPQPHSQPPQSYAYSNSSNTPTPRTFPPEPSPYQPRYEPAPYRRSSPPPHPSHPRSSTSSTGHDHHAPPPAHTDALRQNPSRNAVPAQPQSGSYYREPLPRHEPEARFYDRMDQPSSHGSQGREPQYRGYPTAPPQSGYQPVERQQVRPADRPEEYPTKRPSVVPYSAPYETTLKRNLDVWEIEQNLESVKDASSKLAQMSIDAFNHAQRYGRTPSADGNPTIQACDAMIHEADRARANLATIREALVEQDRYLAEQHQRREPGKDREYLREESESWPSDQREMSMSGGQNGLKRRGRAAPPGRCHSCNRAETPEWRRGPDGARTLCNACGLHYAKLTRKTANLKGSSATTPQQQGSSLRPKSIDGL